MQNVIKLSVWLMSYRVDREKDDAKNNTAVASAGSNDAVI